MNLSYDQTKRSRSAAGTARTTPGTAGTTSSPAPYLENQYGRVPEYGRTPSTPPTNSTPHLSKAAGGKGAGGQKPQWLTGSQNNFDRKIQHRNSQDRQSAHSGMQQQERTSGQWLNQLRSQLRMAEQDPNYTPSAPPQQQYNYSDVASSLQIPGMQEQVNQIGELSQVSMYLQNPEYQSAFQQWLQQQYASGILEAYSGR